MQAWRVHKGERATKALLGPIALHMGTILTPRQEVLVKNQRRQHGGEVGHVFGSAGRRNQIQTHGHK